MTLELIPGKLYKVKSILHFFDQSPNAGFKCERIRFYTEDVLMLLENVVTKYRYLTKWSYKGKFYYVEFSNKENLDTLLWKL